jgi:RNA polymerase sigma-70 factor (ECF subfamily)
MESTEELIASSLKGDESAQRALFKRYRDLVLKIAYRQLGPSEDLDEAVQEIFIQVFRSLQKYRGGAKFETWVYRIGLNVCADILRYKLRKRKLMIDPLANERISEYADRSPGALDEIISEEGVRNIYVALDGLDKSKRAVLILHDLEEKPLEEIAEITGTPVGTVKSRLFYARKMLRSALEPLKVMENCCENS